MKLRFSLLLVSVLLIILTAGCSVNETPTEPETTQPPTVQTTVPETTEVTEATEPAEDPILTARRELVLEKMRWMQSVIWTPAEDITYTRKNSSNGVEFDKDPYVMTLKAGQLYRGIPYTHGSGSGEGFLDYAVSQDERGVYTISGLGVEDLSGDDGRSPVYYPRIGNDCADALFWAWGEVATSITFQKTTLMTPVNGCIHVGEYECDAEKHTGTKAFCEKNGMPVMYEAYAQLKPGDAVVSGPDGHAMMVSEINVVRMENGTVDAMKSYIKTVHQNINKKESYFDEKLGVQVQLCGFAESEYYFWKLFSSGYIPITCKELIDPSPLPEVAVEMSNKALSLETMFEGTVTCNYRISDVTITIADAAGKPVQQSTCYGREAEMYYLDLNRFTLDTEQTVLRGILDLDALETGSYTVTYTCRVSRGDPLTIGTFTFEK